MCEEVCWAKSGRRGEIQRLKKMVCALKVFRIDSDQSVGGATSCLCSTKVPSTAIFSHSAHRCYLPSQQERWHHQLKTSSASLPLYAQCLRKVSHQRIHSVSIYEESKLKSACRLNDKTITTFSTEDLLSFVPLMRVFYLNA